MKTLEELAKVWFEQHARPGGRTVWIETFYQQLEQGTLPKLKPIEVKAFRHTPPQDLVVTSQLVEDAMQRLTDEGWVQHTFRRSTGHGKSYCLVGALGQEAIIQWNGMLRAPWEEELMNLMGIDTDAWKNLVAWNDAPDRTRDQVVDALMRAAKKLRDLGR